MEFYGGNAQYITPVLLAGGPKGKAVALGLTIAQWAAKNNCDWDTNPTPDDCTNLCGVTSIKGNGNARIYYRNTDTGQTNGTNAYGVLINSVKKTSAGGGDFRYELSYVEVDPNTGARETKTKFFQIPVENACFYLNVNSEEVEVNGRCGGDDPIHKPPPPLPPQTYTTE